ncbi:serine/threonine-protein kinase [Sphaerisporangium dianthi]|uniref:non-specific serine/threonine protein kinase n=1 Tax=Sphaerisporangium dianthi TaxID=1436120 RepID=A0ABV9CHB3_9ACTN
MSEQGFSMPPLIGAQVADYLVEAVVGRGGMATVYRARDRRLGRAVALKVLAPQLSADQRFRDRFVRESRLVAAVDHPNIIPIYEAGEADDLLFIAMRYVDGADLRKLIQGSGPLPVARAYRLFSQIASALDAAHQNGLVHRDVKPANILVSEGTDRDPEHVYLTDFGLTKSTFSEAGLTSHGHFMGTPRYVAPEQIRGLPVDGRSDLYAFACVVYEALSGLPPFQRDTELALLYAHVSHDPPPLTPYRPDLPHSVNQVMNRALAKSPAERYVTCRQFVAALRDAISSDDQPTGVQQAGSSRHGSPGGGAVALPSYPQHADALETAEPTASVRSFATPQQAPADHASLGPVTRPGSAGGARPAAPARRRRRLRMGALIGAGAVLVSVAVAAALLLSQTTAPVGAKRYPGSTAVPMSFEYPGGWEARTHADEYAVVSPAAADFDTLFSVPIASDWAAVNTLLSTHPERAMGLFAEVNDTITTSDPSESLKRSLSFVLPGPADFASALTTDTVAGKPAFRLTGVVNDPTQQGRLDLIVYIVGRGQGRPAGLLVFFCAPGRCDQPVIDRILAGLTFTS